MLYKNFCATEISLDSKYINIVCIINPNAFDSVDYPLFVVCQLCVACITLSWCRELVTAYLLVGRDLNYGQCHLFDSPSLEVVSVCFFLFFSTVFCWLLLLRTFFAPCILLTSILRRQTRTETDDTVKRFCYALDWPKCKSMHTLVVPFDGLVN